MKINTLQLTYAEGVEEPLVLSFINEWWMKNYKAFLYLKNKSKHGNLAEGENILALRLVSKLPDLRAGYANPARRACGSTRRVRFLVWGDRKRTGTSFEVPVLFLVTRTGIEPMLPP